MGNNSYVETLKEHQLPCARCASVLGVESLVTTQQGWFKPSKRGADSSAVLLVRCGIVAQLSWIAVAVVAAAQARGCPGHRLGLPGHEHKDCVAHLTKVCVAEPSPDP